MNWKQILLTIGKWLLRMLGKLFMILLKLAWKAFLFLSWAISELLAATFTALAKYLKGKVITKQ